MSILITGAEGFVGRNLIRDLKSKYSLLHPTVLELDLTNELKVESYLKNHQISHIVHAATTLRQGTSYPADTCENNLRMFFNLLKYKNESTKLINIGSGSEYSRAYWYQKMPEEFFDKNIPHDPHSYAKYLISKYIQERNDKTLISLRIFGIYGEFEDYRYKFISNAIVKNILRLPIIINQNVVYDYLYVRDFSRIIEHFIENDARYNTYNITPSKSVDLVEISRLINQVSDYKSDVHVLNPGVGVEYSGNNEKLMSEIGEFQFTPDEVAIRGLRDYYLSIKDSLDLAAMISDDYLNYAKKLRESYFKKNDE